jgi:hypothetical protein
VTTLHDAMPVRLPDTARALIEGAEAGRANWRARTRAARETFEDRLADTDTDHRNGRLLQNVIASLNAWPGRSMVGSRACLAAVKIAVHCDYDRPFQRVLLRVLDAAVEQGEAEPAQWAHLYDRVCAGEGRPQRFGTQYRVVDGLLVLHQVENPALLDERRKGIGLPPYAEQAARLRRHHAGQVGRRTAATTEATAEVAEAGASPVRPGSDFRVPHQRGRVEATGPGTRRGPA